MVWALVRSFVGSAWARERDVCEPEEWEEPARKVLAGQTSSRFFPSEVKLV